MKQFALLAACGILIPLAFAAEPGRGFSVQPGGLLLQDIAPGQEYDLSSTRGLWLTIRNTDTQPHGFAVTAHRPSQLASGQWLEGYEEIPDPAWLSFEPASVRVEAGSVGRVKMRLSVPEGEAHYNRHWTVGLAVRLESEPGQTLAFAIYPRYQIETAPRAESPSVGAPAFSVFPSTVMLAPSATGGYEGSFSIINGPQSTRYTIAPRAIVTDPKREQIYPSTGFQWLSRVDEVQVTPGDISLDTAGFHTVNVRIPHSEGQTARECLIFIQPGEGRPQFVRARIPAE